MTIELMDWQESYSVGIASIDRQHIKLISILNALCRGIKSGIDVDSLKSAVMDLCDYVEMHFEYEERLLKNAGYPEFEEHKAEHNEMRVKSYALQKRLDTDADIDINVFAVETYDIIKKWLEDHLLGTDKKYSGFLVDKGVQ